MRVLQLIDSLSAGGAEKMAVSYANGLLRRIDASFLCCTRKEGVLKNQLSPEVGYLFLEKKGSLDPRAFLRFRRFIAKNKIGIIHAHGTSYFLATLVKLSLSDVKLIWHDHYGKDMNIKPGFLKFFSRFFDGNIVVNSALKKWSEKHLYSRKIEYLPNFLPSGISVKKAECNIEDKSFKILCTANIRPVKDHLNLLKATLLIIQSKKKVHLNLIGKDYEDEYSNEIKAFIREHKLENDVFIYGAQENVETFIEEADLGILASKSEGLPVSLLEYGRAGLPVVCTDVGECAQVIGEFGKVVPVNNPEALAGAILFYLEDETKRNSDAKNFQQKILSEFSGESILPKVINFYNSLK